MKTEHIDLPPLVPGQPVKLIKHIFGSPSNGRKAYIQAGLHADEHPGMLTVQHLMAKLQELESKNMLSGQVTVVPMANPLGMLQNIFGYWTGRFNLADGENFNRNFPDIVPDLANLTCPGNKSNFDVMSDLLTRFTSNDCVSTLKRLLLKEALNNNIVLDLHCDTSSILHVYTNEVHTAKAVRLAASLGGKVVFTEQHAGGQPFDESVFRTCKVLADKGIIPEEDIPFAVTLELRGQTDVRDYLAQSDAEGLVNFLTDQGVITPQTHHTLDLSEVQTYPLAAASHLLSPASGILAWRKQPGDAVTAGECIAEIVHLDSPPPAARTPLISDVTGVFIARPVMMMIRAGQRAALLAGKDLIATSQQGNLLKHF